MKTEISVLARTISVLLIIQLASNCIVFIEGTKIKEYFICARHEDCEKGVCCSNLAEYAKICYKDCSNLLNAETTRPPFGPEKIGNRTYKIYLGPWETWFGGVAKCCEDGGMIADFRSNEEYLGVHSMAQRAIKDYGTGWGISVGVNNIQVPKTFTWVSKEKFSPLPYLNPRYNNQPYSCGRLHSIFPSPKNIDNYDCNQYAPYMCVYSN